MNYFKHVTADLWIAFGIGSFIGLIARLWICHGNWMNFMNPFYPFNLLIN